MPRKTTKKTKAKAPVQKTLVTFLLDRSGSMGSIKSNTIESFNSYLGGLKKDGGELVDFTFLQFDTQSLDKIYIAEPIGKVELLRDDTFIPRAGTPLIDACVKTIKAVEESLSQYDVKPKVVICFQTDGEENCSQEYDWNFLNSLIKRKTEEGWQFNFMGAGIDAYQQAARMGISAAATMSYQPDSMVMSNAAFAASASNTSMFASGKLSSTNYTIGQKRMSGDKFDPNLNAPIPKGTGEKK